MCLRISEDLNWPQYLTWAIYTWIPEVCDNSLFTHLFDSSISICGQVVKWINSVAKDTCSYPSGYWNLLQPLGHFVWSWAHQETDTFTSILLCSSGSDPTYMSCVTHFARCTSQKPTNHMQFLHSHGCFYLSNVQYNLLPWATAY